MVDIVAADREAVRSLRLHPANREEIKALVDLDEQVALSLFADSAEEIYEVKLGGATACVMGVHAGVVSLVFAEWVDALPLSFFKTSRKVVDELRQRYPELGGRIYCHNHFSLRWARFLGFKIDPAQPYGPKQELFHRFYTEVNPDVS